MLRQILHELKKLYAQHAPQLKPRNMHRQLSPPPHSVDPVQDMYDILEGSALIPFLEVCAAMSLLIALSLFNKVSYGDVYTVKGFRILHLCGNSLHGIKSNTIRPHQEWSQSEYAVNWGY